MDTPILPWLRDAALWQVGAALLLCLLLAREAGNAFRQRHNIAHAGASANSTENGYMVSAILGLLALLIGFTFSLALNRFEARQALVQQEAVALGTFLDRQDVFSAGDELRPLLAAYLDARLLEVNGDATAAVDVDQLGRQLWLRAIAVARSQGSPPLETFLLTPLDAASDGLALQRLERERRIEAGVLSLLIVYAAASSFTLGYAAPGRQQRGLAAMLSLLLVMCLLAILDLDRPNTGRSRLSDTALRTVMSTMAFTGNADPARR